MEYVTVQSPIETWVYWTTVGIRANRLYYRTTLSYANALKDSIERA